MLVNLLTITDGTEVTRVPVSCEGYALKYKKALIDLGFQVSLTRTEIPQLDAAETNRGRQYIQDVK